DFPSSCSRPAVTYRDRAFLSTAVRAVLPGALLHRCVLERAGRSAAAVERPLRSYAHAGRAPRRCAGLVVFGDAAVLWIPLRSLAFAPVYGAGAGRGRDLPRVPGMGAGRFGAGGDGCGRRRRARSV